MPDEASTRRPELPRARRRRRLGAVLSLLALTTAGGGAWLTARMVADSFEQRLSRDARQALAQAGHDWADVNVDGTLVHLGGAAPDEVTRYRALVLTENATPAGRVVDGMTIAATDALVAPVFQVQLLRTGDEVALIGLVPAGLDREAVASGLRRAGAGQISDLVETADYPVPPQWDAAFAFGLRAAGLVPHAKITITPGHVAIQATADSIPHRDSLQEILTQATPEHVTLEMEIIAPRPLIAPFALRFVRDDDGARFETCAADTQTARDAILAAGQRAGAQGQADCPLGLGVPSDDWAQAATLSIEALDMLGAGAISMSDARITLTAPASVDAATFHDVAGGLANALPPPFTLTAEHQDAADGDDGPTEFIATVPRPGHVILRGPVAVERMRDTVESFARSRFGVVDSTLRLDPDLPGDWTLRSIGALEALSDLDRGSVRVGPDLIRITGVSGSETASDAMALRLSERLGAGVGYEMTISYDPWLDPVLGLPSGAECIDRLNTIMRESVIGFEPSRSVIAGDAEPTLLLLADVMADCAAYRIEAGGHTDSQGSDSFNARLSQQRAEALVQAMTDHGIDASLMTAHGYGESQPIADNDTAAGREANRRIEFRLIADEPVRPLLPAPATITGVTVDGAEAVTEMPAPQITPIPMGPLQPAGAQSSDDTGGSDAARNPAGLAPHDLAHAVMAATILVSDLVLTPEVAVETIEELEGTSSDPDGPAAAGATTQAADALIRAATGAVSAVLDPGTADPATIAATLGLRVTDGEVPILTPQPDTPRPPVRP